MYFQTTSGNTYALKNNILTDKNNHVYSIVERSPIMVGACAQFKLDNGAVLTTTTVTKVHA